MLAIETTGLTKCYGNKTALNALDLEVEQGSIFGLLGPNGAGKTTALSLLLQLRFPTAGKIKISGRDISNNHQEIFKNVGYMAESNNMYGYMTVSELIQFSKGLHNNWDSMLAQQCLEIFELPLDEKISSLSQGMKKLVAITVALAPKPDILILDEPTAGLDPIKKREFFGLLMEEIAETSRTALISSHNLSDLERVADTIGILHQGRLVKVGNVADMKAKFRKMIVAWEEGDLPSGLAKTDFVSAVQNDGMWTLVSDDLHIRARVEQSNPKFIKTYQMNLEDVFLLYTTKRRSEHND